MQEFHTVHELIAHLPTKQRQDFIWNRIIYANPIKPNETLQELDQYKPLVTFDNHEEVKNSQALLAPALHYDCEFQTPVRWWSFQANLVPSLGKLWS